MPMLPRAWQFLIPWKDLQVLLEVGSLHYEQPELDLNLHYTRSGEPSVEVSVTFIPSEGHVFKPPTS